MPAADPTHVREAAAKGQLGVFDDLSHAVFDDWREAMGYPDARYHAGRARVIGRILAAGYTRAECYEVARHADAMPWRRGRNASGKTFDGIGELYGSLDRFEALLHAARSGIGSVQDERDFRRGDERLLPGAGTEARRL